MKKVFKNFLERWKAETPKVAKKIRNISFTLAGSLPAAWVMTVNIPQSNLPAWCGTTVAIATFFFAMIGGYAGTRRIDNNNSNESIN